MTSILKSGFAAGALIALLAGCGNQEVLLTGQRLDPVTGQDAGLADAPKPNRALPIALPPATVNAEWSQVGGNAAHWLPQPALGPAPGEVWRAGIGARSDRKHRITAQPIVAGGRVFTLDSEALVSSFSTSGAPLWTRDLTPPTERRGEASGGGLAAAGNALYVTTGFGRLTALDAATGNVLWEQYLESPPAGAPMAASGAVFVVTRNAVGWALDARTGRILWQVLGTPSNNGIAGGSAPALAGSLAVMPFDSDQIMAVEMTTGTAVWGGSVAGERTGQAFSRISDLTGGPVVAGGVIYAGSQSGRAAAFEAATGKTVWRANEGAMSPVSVAGGSVFMVTDENRLVRLDAKTGETIWAVDLPLFLKSRIARRKTLYSHYGPLLAGGRLIVVSDDGWMRQFDPATGALISATALPGRAAADPVVAGGTLYLVTEDGVLHAFR